jgi:hypothetical protein
MTEGYIYCFSNESMPGILKVGWTKKSPNKILKRANSSHNYWGPPTPFKFEFAKKVKDPAEKGEVFIKLFDTIKKCDNSGHFIRDKPEHVRMIFELIDGRWSVEIVDKIPEEYSPIPWGVKQFETYKSTILKDVLKEKDIDLVMSQASVPRYKAIASLLKNKGDIVDTIMELIG